MLSEVDLGRKPFKSHTIRRDSRGSPLPRVAVRLIGSASGKTFTRVESGCFTYTRYERFPPARKRTKLLIPRLCADVTNRKIFFDPRQHPTCGRHQRNLSPHRVKVRAQVISDISLRAISNQFANSAGNCANALEIRKGTTMPIRTRRLRGAGAGLLRSMSRRELNSQLKRIRPYRGKIIGC